MSDPREELEELLNNAVGEAAELLEKDGEFEPFALALRSDGEVLVISAETPEEIEEIEPEQIVESLHSALRKGRREYRAVAVVEDGTLEDGNDQPVTSVIQIALEHQSAEPVKCHVPYEWNGSSLELADLMEHDGERHVFTDERPN